MQSPIPPTASSVPPSTSDARNISGSRRGWLCAYALFVTIAIGGCALDLATKYWTFQRLGNPQIQQGQPAPPIWLVDGIFGFETSLNEGAVFGIGQGQVRVFAALSLIAAVGIVAWLVFAPVTQDLPLTVALALVMAGILGNLYDRLGWHALTWAAGTRGHRAGEPVYAVRDWLHFKIDAIGFDWPIFNLADTFLVCGAILLAWHALRSSN